MTDKPTGAVGWFKFAEHRLPVERVELQHGVLRFGVACVATRNVMAGTSVGELYGADGALVFRHPDMPHGDIWAGTAGAMVINFGMPQMGVSNDMDEIAMDVALANLTEASDVPSISSADMMVKARNRWKIWRVVGISGWAIALSVLASMLGVPWWLTVPAQCFGVVFASMTLHINREWWK